VNAALSELSVTEFVTLLRVGFHPMGLVIGSSVHSAGTPYDWVVATGEIQQLSHAMREARRLAIEDLRQQAKALGADGVVQVRMDVSHHLWRGGHQVVEATVVGTAVAFDRDHAPAAIKDAPNLHRADGTPFDSDLGAADFVKLLAAGYRPVTVAMGVAVFGLDPRTLREQRGQDTEIKPYTQAFFDARELAMDRLQHDLFSELPRGSPDAPEGIVGMTVRESAYGSEGPSGPPIVEFTAWGTAIAPLRQDDPRRATLMPKPRLVVPLDR
jgi:uncharacterized protein YbjQ (UPF0145 family)